MSHITDEQRCIIQRMKKAGRQQKQIAEAIGKSASAVSRELRRNCDGRSGEYNADLAALRGPTTGSTSSIAAQAFFSTSGDTARPAARSSRPSPGTT
jgi:IS30 family transposase